MERLWKCEVCGFIHTGDGPPDECPVCGAGADAFTRFEAVASADASGHGEASAPSLRPDFQRLVVLGAGVAGVTAAEHARAAAPDVSITLVSGEPGWPYFRLNLTRFLAGEVSEESLVLAGRDWMDRHRVELVSAEVLEIDRPGRAVVLRDRTRIPYERLVVATGSRPFVPPIPGVELDGVSCLRTVTDAKALLGRARAGARGVCIGGGLLGLETAGALARRGVRITVLEGAPWLLHRQLAEPAGRHLERYLAGLGMTTRCNVKVEEIVGTDRVERVRLAGAEDLAADFVVIAAGVRPTTDLARAAGLEVKAGIVVDDRLVTSDPAILAAGDVAEHAGRVYGLWSAAYAQGLVAGRNAVGERLEFKVLSPGSRLKVLDLFLMSIGEIQPADADAVVWEMAAADRCIRLVTRHGKLVGANILGQPDLEAAVREALESGVPLSTRPDLAAKLPAEFMRSL